MEEDDMKKLVRILLTALLLLGLLSLPAAAANAPSPVDPSDTLAVYVRVNGTDSLLHTYSLAEMNALAASGTVSYSGIDSMPCPVVTKAHGVYLTALLQDAAKYTGYDLSSYQYLRTRSTDGATGRFTKDQLFGDRYYFPGLHEQNGAWDPEETEVDQTKLGSGTRVEPMLSITAEQDRKPAPSDENDTRHYQPERYTLLFGVTVQELENSSNSSGQRVSQYKRGCEALIIDLGAVAADVPLTGLSLDKHDLSLNVGASAQLTVTPEPLNATDAAVVWSSSNSAAVAVSATGVVTAKSAGTATVTAAARSNSAISVSCTVKVAAADIKVTGVTLTPATLTLAVGREKQLSALVRPSDATNKNLTWSSSVPSVATVDGSGLVKALKPGETTVIVTTEDGNFRAACQVTVTAGSVPLTGLSISRSAAVIAKGDSFQLEAVFTPANTTERDVTWSSSQPGVATVSTTGLVRGRNLGTSLISVRSADGKYVALCQITVAATAASFTDTSGHWAEDYIEQMVADGYLSGYSDGSFQPDRPITRAEFSAILMRILHDKQGLALSGSASFKDTATHWARDYIAAAASQGIASGMGDGYFRPDASVTREQITVLLTNAVKGNGAGLPLAFSDSSSVSSWARDSVAFASSQGWISGYSDGSFGPARSATRAEVCAMLCRFCQYYQ